MRGASYYNPYRHGDRVRDRRNAILALMRGNGFIGDREYALAVESPLKLVSGPAESSDAPYFVDMLNDDLERRFPGYDFHARSDKIYTSLDLDLQKAANEAVAIGMKQVDDLVRKQKRFRNAPFVEPQCALIALDPAHRRNQGAGRRPQLRRQPVEPRAFRAPDGVDLQTVRLRGRHEHRRRGRNADSDAGLDRSG